MIKFDHFLTTPDWKNSSICVKNRQILCPKENSFWTKKNDLLNESSKMAIFGPISIEVLCPARWRDKNNP